MVLASGTYELREVTHQDYNFIYHVKTTTLKPHIELVWGWDEAVQTKYLEESFGLETQLIITYEDKEIGVLELNELAQRIDVVELEILPEYQRKGIGTQILQDIIDEYTEKGTHVGIGCFKINRDAKRLYERLGFSLIKETNTHYVLEL
ncbi:MAG: GNAT family N-acetyltransferase [Cellulosilyticaceae bacterium]